MKRALLFMNKGVPFSYLLDDYPTAAIAYSFRKLRSAYIGNCIEVRRSSDNTTSNIGFVNNILDEASLLSFVGAGDGFIKTWYDQSGNVNNMTQSTNANQPRIVSSGVVEKQSGKPAVYSSTNMRLSSGQFSNATHDSAFTICRMPTSVNAMIPFTTSGISGSWYYGNCINGGGVNSAWGASPVVYKNGSASAVTNTTGAFYTAFVTGNLRFLLSEISAVTIASQNRSTQYALPGTEQYFQEHITYNANKTSDKAGIETNINNYYSIY